MVTKVHIKMDAWEQLLQSEEVCRQLEIVSYHEEVQVRWGCNSSDCSQNSKAYAPRVMVHLLNYVQLQVRQSMVAKLSVDQATF